MASVSIRINGDLRPSHLVKSISNYVRRSLVTILRMFFIYRPVFFWPRLSFSLIGAAATLRFLCHYFFSASGDGHLQSLVLDALWTTLSALMFALAVLADILSVNRKLLERIAYYV